MADNGYMPEMRHDPVQRRWVVISPDRSKRPTDFIEKPEADEVDDNNPFAEGNEEQTPSEIAAVRKQGTPKNGPGWSVRVVPNRFPAFRIEGEVQRRADGIYDSMNGVGAHEVVIESPRADGSLTEYDEAHLFQVGKMYRERLTDLMKDGRFRYVLLFKNHRKAAGASLSHPHSQIVATPVTPLSISQELESARRHYNDKERCLFCDIIHQEVRDRKRIVMQNDRFIAFAPYASRFPFEVWLMPLYHQHDFRLISDEDLKGFMNSLQDVLTRLKVTLRDPPYNFVLHTSPSTEIHDPRPTHWTTLHVDWHWHLEILPRIRDVAGFEWGTGFFMNVTPPEQAAEMLRSVDV